MKQILAYFNQPLLKLPLLFGLITGVLCFMYFLALYALDVPPLGNIRSLDFGIHIIMMIGAVWYYRRKVGHGMLHLWEGISICYIINSVAALVTGWLIYLFITQVDPNVFTQYVANSRQLLLSGKAQIVKQFGQATFDEQWAQINTMKPGVLLPDELSKKTALAVLPVLIISLIFRKQDYSVLK